MAIPTYDALILPLLKHYGDGKEKLLVEVGNILAQQFTLSPEEMIQRLPSGFESIFRNRVGWARTYLKKAGLIDRVSKGVFKITERGTNVLRENPSSIDRKYLMRFEEFQVFQAIKGPPSKKKRLEDITKGNSDTISQTPEELINSGIKEINDALVVEVLDRVKKSSPEFFEQLIVDLLIKMGYGGTQADAGRRIGRSGDGGIDGVIQQDKLGLDEIFLQAKRWENVVGRPIIQGFVGSLEGKKAHRGVLITTSSFTKDAEQYVETINKRVVLIGGNQLALLMLRYNIGIATKETYELKKIDEDYFSQE
ncbi:MAG: restriction endonuclease [candidate division Zixibacteria bacterium]|nr:restriction endonuclease [candidate division Zixibacteria bacterium]